MDVFHDRCTGRTIACHTMIRVLVTRVHLNRFHNSYRELGLTEKMERKKIQWNCSRNGRHWLLLRWRVTCSRKITTTSTHSNKNVKRNTEQFTLTEYKRFHFKRAYQLHVHVSRWIVGTMETSSPVLKPNVVSTFPTGLCYTGMTRVNKAILDDWNHSQSTWGIITIKYINNIHEELGRADDVFDDNNNEERKTIS